MSYYDNTGESNPTVNTTQTITIHDWSNRMRNVLSTLSDTPRYVETTGKYDTCIYLITSEQDLIDVMVRCVKRWKGASILSSESWFFDGTYDEYFKARMKMTQPQFDSIMAAAGQESTDNHFLTKLAEMAESLPRIYLEEMESLHIAKFYTEVANDNLGNRAGSLYNALTKELWNNSPMFSLNRFDPMGR